MIHIYQSINLIQLAYTWKGRVHLNDLTICWAQISLANADDEDIRADIGLHDWKRALLLDTYDILNELKSLITWAPQVEFIWWLLILKFYVK